MCRIVMWLLKFSGIALILTLCFALASAQEDLDPIKVAPGTHKLVFENALLRVIQAQVPPGGHEPKHRHPHGVTVYLADYEVETKTFPDGQILRGKRRFGTVDWSEAVIHEVTNVGNTPSHAIRIELKY